MKRLIPPLTGLAVFALATGYLLTLVPLRVNASYDSEMLAGYIGGFYFMGLLAGSFRSERLVAGIGHIRSFAAFMAVMCASVLGLALSDNIFLWLLLRFINGVTVAGVFVVVESWLLCESQQNNRGRIVAFYMVALYGAQALGQLFIGWLDITSLFPFILVGILLALSILPTTISKIPPPEINQPSSLGFMKLYQMSPSGVIGCFCGGVVLGALYTLLPIYLLNNNSSDYSIGVMLGLTIAGGMLMQYPAGHLSDYIDRRLVLSGVCILGTLSSLAIYWLSPQYFILMFLLFLVGGTTFTLYPLAISHSCDHMEPQDIVAGTQGLLLAYSGGSCIGPILGAYFMTHIDRGLPLFFASIMGTVALFFMVRLPARPQIYSSNEHSFVPVTRTTPVMSQIDPRSHTDEAEE